MIYHISHIDLDGYGCQIITKKHFKNKKIKFYNCNYGNVILNILNNILLDIKENKYKNNQLIITDINLSMDIANYVDNVFVKKNKIKVLLLDHHITGSDVAKRYKWYILNDSMCASKMTQLHFKVTELEDFANYVNVQDLWYDKHHFFSQANFIADIAYKGYEFPDMIEEESYKYKIFTIKEVFYKFRKNWSIKKIQKNFIDIQEKFLLTTLDKSYVRNKNISIEHKFVKYIYEKIKFKNHNIIQLDNSKGFVFFELSSNIFQQIAHMFLNDFIDKIDFVIYINKYGRVSLRSIGDTSNKNVSLIASKYFYGGGHFNSAGGSLFNHKFKEIDNESEAIKIINDLYNHMNSIELIKVEPTNSYLLELIENHKDGTLYSFKDNLYILTFNNFIYKLLNIVSNQVFIFNNKIEKESLDKILLKFQEQIILNKQ